MWYLKTKFLHVVGLSALLLFTSTMSQVAQAQRIKDVAQVAGVRSNQLMGYGLVVGLPGTADAVY